MKKRGKGYQDGGLIPEGAPPGGGKPWTSYNTERALKDVERAMGGTEQKPTPAAPQPDWGAAKGGPSSEAANRAQKQIDEKRANPTPPPELLRRHYNKAPK